jgi:dynein intermediate chain, cytosolic
LTPRITVDLIDTQQELFELPQRERVIYNKEVQTTEVEVETTRLPEDDLWQRITREKEVYEAAREKELEEESIRLDQEIEQEIKGITIRILTLLFN